MCSRAGMRAARRGCPRHAARAGPSCIRQLFRYVSGGTPATVRKRSANDVRDIAAARASSSRRQGFPGSSCISETAGRSRSSVSSRSQPGREFVALRDVGAQHLQQQQLALLLDRERRADAIAGHLVEQPVEDRVQVRRLGRRRAHVADRRQRLRQQCLADRVDVDVAADDHVGIAAVGAVDAHEGVGFLDRRAPRVARAPARPRAPCGCGG